MKSRKWVTAIAACLILLSPAPVVTAPVTVFDKLTFPIAANNATPAAPPRIAPVYVCQLLTVNPKPQKIIPNLF